MGYDIAALMSVSEDTHTYDISELLSNATHKCGRRGRHGEVRTRVMSADELAMEQSRAVQTYGLGVRHRELRHYEMPQVISAGVVKRYIITSRTTEEFVRRLSKHYGRYFSPTTLNEIVERAWYNNEATEV